MSSAQRILIFVFILLGVFLVVFFGMRAVHSFRRIHDGGFGPRKQPPAGETDVEMIRDWMTVPYIARTYSVPDKMLFNTLGIPEEGNRDKSLKIINFEYFPDADGIVLRRIKAAILANQPPGPPVPPTP